VAHEGLAWLTAAGSSADAGLPAAIGAAAIHQAQAGLLADMDAVADALWQRAAQGQQAA
jgi:hypothetical protein